MKVNGQGPTWQPSIASSSTSVTVEARVNSLALDRLSHAEEVRQFFDPQPFPGTMKDLQDLVESDIHATIDDFDYDGLKPYLKLIDQLSEHPSFEAMRLDTQGEETEGTCVGAALATLRCMSKKGVYGYFAGIKKSDETLCSHAVALVQCSDGYVMIDNRSAKDWRWYPIPLKNSEDRFPPEKGGLLFSVNSPPTDTPLTYLDSKDVAFSCCIHAKDIQDEVLKHYTQAAIHSFIPIAVYKNDGTGKSLNYIKVWPQEQKIEFKKGDPREMTFADVRAGKLTQEELQLHMGEDFHVPQEVALKEILRFISSIDKIKTIVSNTLQAH